MKKLFLFLAGLSVCFLCQAQEAAKSTVALAFTQIDNQPSSIALGGLSLINGSPTARLHSKEKADISVSWQNWQPKTTQNTHLFGAASFRLGKRLSLSADFLFRGGKSYEVFDNNGNSKGEFKPSQMAMSLGAGFLLTNHLSVGARFRYATSKIGKDALSAGFSADVLVTFNSEAFSVTGGVCNAGPSVKSQSGDSFSQPMSAAILAGYSLPVGLSFYAGGNYYFSGGLTAALGVQYAYKDVVFVRAGYHLGTGDAPIPSFASVGLGVKFVGIHIDASYLLASEVLGNTLALGVGFAF